MRTHEFYEARATLTKRLVQEKEFNMLAIEGDWPDAYTVHRYTSWPARLEREPTWSTCRFRALSLMDVA